jgi:hypothetical protein
VIRDGCKDTCMHGCICMPVQAQDIDRMSLPCLSCRDMTGQRNIYMVREGVKYACSPDQVEG